MSADLEKLYIHNLNLYCRPTTDRACKLECNVYSWDILSDAQRVCSYQFYKIQEIVSNISHSKKERGNGNKKIEKWIHGCESGTRDRFGWTRPPLGAIHDAKTKCGNLVGKSRQKRQRLRNPEPHLLEEVAGDLLGPVGILSVQLGLAGLQVGLRSLDQVGALDKLPAEVKDGKDGDTNVSGNKVC